MQIEYAIDYAFDKAPRRIYEQISGVTTTTERNCNFSNSITTEKYTDNTYSSSVHLNSCNFGELALVRQFVVNKLFQKINTMF